MTRTVSGAPSTDGRMSLMEHLIELRSRLIKCVLAVTVCGVLGWMLYFPVLDILRNPLEKLADDPNVSAQFQTFEPLELFMLRLKVSAYLGIALSMPFLLWQLWQFIAPGLYQNERRYAGAFVGSATVLFAMGAFLSYSTLPAALGFLQSMGGGQVETQYTAEAYLTLIVYMMVAFGIGFQFPILLVFLQLVGILTPEQLAGFRRFAIVLVFVAAAIITPSGDPISLLALSLPMVVFYEISIVIGRLVRRRRAANEAATGA